MTDDADPPAQPDPAYEVGYGKPPKQHQIKPGERRNPYGRPRGRRNAKKIVLEEHNRLVAFQEQGRTRKKPALELIIRKDVNDALKGNEKAKARQIDLGLRLTEEAEAKNALKSLQQTLAEDEAILARYLSTASPRETPDD